MSSRLVRAEYRAASLSALANLICPDAHAPYAIAHVEGTSAPPRPAVAPSSNSLLRSSFPLRLHLLQLLPTPRVSNTILLSSNHCSHLLQLHRKVISSIIIIPTLLPQMRVRPLRTDFFLFGPIFTTPLAFVLRDTTLLLRMSVWVVPSTGKSSNSSSSSSCTAGFWGWRGLLVSLVSVIMPWGFAAALLGPDMLRRGLLLVVLGAHMFEAALAYVR